MPSPLDMITPPSRTEAKSPQMGAALPLTTTGPRLALCLDACSRPAQTYSSASGPKTRIPNFEQLIEAIVLLRWRKRGHFVFTKKSMAARSSVETPSSEYTSSSSRSHSSCSGSCSCRRRENSPRSHNDGPKGIIAVENWCNSTLRMSCSGFLSLDLSIHSASSTPTWGKQLLGLTHSWWLVESMRNYHLSPRSHWWHDRESDVGPKLLISLDSAIVLAYLNYLSNNNTNNDALLMREAFLKAVIGAPLILKRAPSSLHKTWEDR
ncbi:hypothetical protein BIW11_08073, partial [Tropilaelaps mercedesae]